MKLNIPDEVIEFIKKFEDKKYEIYIVGGAVRDLLVGKFVVDWDFTTNATPDEIEKILPNSFYDNKFGTVGIEVNKRLKPFEITTYRKEEGYSDSRRPDKVTWGKTLEEDLARRDFTIDAMALRLVSLAQGKPSNLDLIDPYGGQKDLEKKIIRAVGDPNKRLKEDALRLARAVRIAAQLGFTIEEKTFEAIRNNAALINKIAMERVRDELLKLLGSPYPYEGVLLFRNSGLMQEILPEFETTFGVEQKSPARHHIYDVGQHSLYSLKFCKSDDPVVRLAALIHDIGKPSTFKKLESGIITFYNHEIVGSRIANKIASRLRFSKRDSDRLFKLVRFHQFSVNEQQTDSAIRRFIRNVGIENLADILTLRVADRLGSGAKETSWRLEEFKLRLIEVQKQPFAVRDLKIDGHDIMKILQLKSGPKVGEILDKLFEAVVEKKIVNKRSVLMERLKSYLN